MHIVNAFRRGLSGAGYVEHRNVAIYYSWAEGRPDRLPALAAELVSREVTVWPLPSDANHEGTL
jgi:putative tryptophan/tyrosine transport system substrate-binding protein